MLVWSLAMLVQLLWTGVWSICSAPSRARAALAWEVRLRPLIITTSIAVRANRVNKPAAAQPAYSAYAVMECQFMIRWAICRDINPSRKKMEPSAGMALPWHCFGRLNPHRHTFCLLASERKQMIDICGGWMCVRMCICMCMFMCLHWMWQVKMLRNTSDWQGSKRIASFSAFTLLGSLNKTFLWFDSIHKCAEFESHVLQITSKFQDFQKWPKICQLAEPWAAPLALPSPCQTFSGSEFCSWNNVWSLQDPTLPNSLWLLACFWPEVAHLFDQINFGYQMSKSNEKKPEKPYRCSIFLGRWHRQENIWCFSCQQHFQNWKCIMRFTETNFVLWIALHPNRSQFVNLGPLQQRDHMQTCELKPFVPQNTTEWKDCGIESKALRRRPCNAELKNQKTGHWLQLCLQHSLLHLLTSNKSSKCCRKKSLIWCKTLESNLASRFLGAMQRNRTLTVRTVWTTCWDHHCKCIYWLDVYILCARKIEKQ